MNVCIENTFYREHILQRTHSLENTPSAGIDDDDLRDDARAECLSVVVVDRLVARREGTRPRAKTRPEACMDILGHIRNIVGTY